MASLGLMRIIEAKLTTKRRRRRRKKRF